MTQIVDIRRHLGLRIGREKRPLEVLCLFYLALKKLILVKLTVCTAP